MQEEVSSDGIHLTERVEESNVGPWKLLAIPAPVPSVVSIRGSFCTYPDFAAGDAILQDLVVTLLDKGTKRRDRFQIAEELDNRGAQLSTSSDGFRVRFSARALPQDVPAVVEILAEQLREPLFDDTEFEKARAQVAARLQRELESTGAQAASALSRMLYHATHPNHAMSPEDALERLASYSVDDVRTYYDTHFSAAEAIFCISGDLEKVRPGDLVGRHLVDWKARVQRIEVPDAAIRGRIGTDRVPLPDKSNTDVRLGHPLHLLRQDSDYVPLYVGNYVLGGNFAARLMTIIRDQMGLTYGIWSGISGVTTSHSGHWAVGVTLSEENAERGTAATRREMERFVSEGITGDELNEKQTTITGSFKVGLATTGGLAGTVLHNAERGFEVEYLERFPHEVQSLTLDRVNEAVRSHLHPDKLAIAMAGGSL